MPRPTILPVQSETIPETLKRTPAWVVWRCEERKGKWTKPPYDAHTGRPASSTDPETWTTFEKAWRAYSRPSHPWDGIGIVLSPENPLTGVDLDHCIDKNTGEVADWATGIVDEFASYTERSPSGEGIRTFIFADLPPGGRKNGDIEIYERGRFLTVTGHALAGIPMMVEERTDTVAAWHAVTFPKQEKAATNGPRPNLAPLDVTDEQLLEVARGAKNGADVDRLLRGDWQHSYKSQSEADLALCSHLAFYCQGDAARIDRIFRASGMMREKWDEPHHADGTRYGDGTIGKALAGITEFWTPPNSIRVFETANRNGNGKREEGEENTGPSISGPVYLETDTGNAERLQYQHGRDLRYCHPWKKWLVWDGIRWVPDATAEAERKAISTAKSIWKEVAAEDNEERRKRLVRHAMATEAKDRIKGMLCMLTMLSGIPVLPNDLDADPWRLCCSNGTLDLRTGELRESRRSHLITKLAPVEFDADAKCPQWEAFLGQIFNNSEEMIAFIQRAVGYSLTGTVRERCFFVCHGEGANGKSTFFDVIGSMLGEYSYRTPTETLLMRRDDALTNDLAALMGKRFVFASESEEDRRLAVSRIKDMTGRDKITARFLHQEFFTFEPEFKLWLATNHRPRITDTNRAIWDRVRLVPFNVTIEKKRQDADLPEKLKAEHAGILAWAVRGCLDWLEHGLSEPEEVTKATAAYRSAEDVTDQFLTGMTTPMSGVGVQVDRLFQAYFAWATKAGEKPVTRRKFNDRLKEKGYETHSGTGNYTFWLNLQLLQQSSDEE